MIEKFTQNNLEMFDEKALDAFLTDLNQYDKEHNVGTWMGRGLAGMHMQGMREETAGTEDEMKMNESLEKLQKKIQENLTIDDLENRHNPTLNKLGLNLESPNKQGNIEKMSTLERNSLLIQLVVKEHNFTIMPWEIIQLQIIQAIRGANGEIDKVLKNWEYNPDIDPRK
jgi:hypothetical protein